MKSNINNDSDSENNDSKTNNIRISNNDDNKSFNNDNNDKCYDWISVLLIQPFLKLAFYNFE